MIQGLSPRSTALVLVRRSIADIAAEVCRRRGNVFVGEIFGRNSCRRVSHARHEVIWIARQLGYSLHMIGRRFPRPENVEGCMDHSTVLNGEQRHALRLRAATMDAIRQSDADSVAAYRDYLAASHARPHPETHHAS